MRASPSTTACHERVRDTGAVGKARGRGRGSLTVAVALLLAAGAALPAHATGLARHTTPAARSDSSAPAQPAAAPDTFVGQQDLVDPPSTISGLAVDAAGDLFLADRDANRVSEIPKGGAQRPLAFTNLQSPDHIQLDGAGDVYVLAQSTSGQAAVYELTPAGKQTELFAGLTIGGFAVDQAGDVFVSDVPADTVLEKPVGGAQVTVPFGTLADPGAVAVGPGGEVAVGTQTGVLQLPSGGSPSYVATQGSFDTPEALAYDTDGDLFLLDGRVYETPAGHTSSTDVTLVHVATEGYGNEMSDIATRGSADLYVANFSDEWGVTEVPIAGPPVFALPSSVAATGAIAVDADDDMYLVDATHDTIVEVTPTDTTTTLAITGLSAPSGIAVDSSGDVFVSDTGHGRVVELPKGGNQKTVAISGLSKPGALAVDAKGDLFVLDTGNLDALEVPPQGAEAIIDSSFSNPTGVGVDDTGHVYVSEKGPVGYIRVSTPPDPTNVWVPDFFDGESVAIAVDPAGDIFMVGDNEGDVEEAPAGAPTTYGIGSPAKLAGGVAVDPTGNLFETDATSNDIVELPLAARQTYPDPQAVTPQSVAIAPNDSLYADEMVEGSASSEFDPWAIATDEQDMTTRISNDLSGVVGGIAVDPNGVAYVSEQYGLANLSALALYNYGGGSNCLGFDARGNVYVIYGSEIQEIGPDTLGTVTLPFSGLGYHLCLAVDGQGDVYVADTDHHRVVEVPHGKSQVLVPFTGLVSPSGIAVDELGDLYVSDGNKVVELPKSGSQESLPFTGLLDPTSLAVDSELNVFAAGQSTGITKLLAKPAVPWAPGKPTVSGANGQATLGWARPISPGTPITGYSITPYLNGVAQTPVTVSATTYSTTITGLTNGGRYTFRVAAVNGVGRGALSAATPLVVPPFGSLATLISRQFEDFLGRAPSATELATWTTNLTNGQSPGSLAAFLRKSSESTTFVDPTARLYFAYFLRPPDVGGLQFWVSQRRAGKSLYAISSSFAASSEFKTRYGSLSNSAFVKLIYQNVLGRAPDSGGLGYWTGQLDSGTKTRGQVMVGFSESSEYKQLEQPSVDVVVTWIDMLVQSPPTATFQSWVAQLAAGTATVADLANAIVALPAYGTRIA
jgi:sugar lactone lactonase YvrE